MLITAFHSMLALLTVNKTLKSCPAKTSGMRKQIPFCLEQPLDKSSITP